MSRTAEGTLAVLWELEWEGDRLACAIYRLRDGLQLRVEAPDAVVITEQFEMQPRALARARRLKSSLMRRGWRDAKATGTPEE